MAVDDLVKSTERLAIRHDDQSQSSTRDASGAVTTDTTALEVQDSTPTTPEKEPPTLMTIPAEVRLLIYSALFNPNNSSPRPTMLVQDPDRPSRQRFERQPPLLRVCHTIREEAKPVWLAETTFVAIFASKSDPVQDKRANSRLEKWLQLMGPKLAGKITTLKLKIDTNIQMIWGRVLDHLKENEPESFGGSLDHETMVLDVLGYEKEFPEIRAGVALDAKVKPFVRDADYYARVYATLYGDDHEDDEEGDSDGEEEDDDDDDEEYESSDGEMRASDVFPVHEESLIKKEDIIKTLDLGGLGLKMEAIGAWCGAQGDWRLLSD